MESSSSNNNNQVAIIPLVTFNCLIGQLNEAREEICCFAGNRPDPDARRVLNSIEDTLDQVADVLVAIPDPELLELLEQNDHNPPNDYLLGFNSPTS